ncbi:hypothetical protein DL767_001527 [Monosporascus sp. MG133]|nr:hypothetical protein DL767_001527 [Monosporascus sp. MG133]
MDVLNVVYTPGQDGEQRQETAAVSYTSTAQQYGTSNAAYTSLPQGEHLQTRAPVYAAPTTPPKKSNGFKSSHAAKENQQAQNGGQEYSDHCTNVGTRWFCNICKETISPKGSSVPTHINKKHIFLSPVYASYHIS